MDLFSTLCTRQAFLTFLLVYQDIHGILGHKLILMDIILRSFGRLTFPLMAVVRGLIASIGQLMALMRY